MWLILFCVVFVCVRCVVLWCFFRGVGVLCVLLGAQVCVVKGCVCVSGRSVVLVSFCCVVLSFDICCDAYFDSVAR